MTSAPHLLSVAVLLASMLSGPPVAAASGLERALADPDAARFFDYCAWRFTARGSADDVPQLAPLLEKGGHDASVERKRAAALVDAGTRVALAADSERGCRRELAAGSAAHAKAERKAARRFRSGDASKAAKDPAFAEIQQGVHEHWARDQAARQVYVATKTEDREGASFWASRLAYSDAAAADARSTALLQDALSRFDWIDAHRFGAPTSRHAWLLAQHADSHPELQELALEGMARYLEGGGVRRSDYAHLFDRVAVNRGRLQRYGTQPDWTCRGGKLELMPLEDPDGVDGRRAAMGLGPVQEGLDAMSQATCGGSASTR